MIKLDQKPQIYNRTKTQSQNLKSFIISYINKNILPNQNPVSGLFTNSSFYGQGNGQKSSKHRAHLRDTLYASYTLYAGCIALRNDPYSKIFKLSATQAMRSALTALMRQSDKVKKFKSDQDVNFSLATVFDAETGLVIEDRNLAPENSFLYLDDIALFLLILCQLVTGGLNIVYSKVDVDFCQNIVYYLERAYRVADHGPTKSKGGDESTSAIPPTLHATTIGIAKAALEAASQCNLLGTFGDHSTKLHVDPDAHNRNRMTLESLLPRQSVYQETDEHLSIIVGFPCFAVNDERLIQKTLEKCVESENFWKLREFSAALEIGEHLVRMNNCESAGNIWKIPINPKYDQDFENFEITSTRGHSFHLLAYMVTNNMLTMTELDPCKRFIQNLEKNNNPIPLRINPQDVEINVILISESSNTSNLLKSFGIKSQTIEEVWPVEIWSSRQLLEAYSHLGKNEMLGFDTGRPDRPMGSLATSQIYRIIEQDDQENENLHETSMTKSKLIIPFNRAFETSEFYSSEDDYLTTDKIWCSLHFLAKYWTFTVPPVFVFLVKDESFYSRRYVEKSSNDPTLVSYLSMLNSIKNGTWNGIRTRITTVRECINEISDFVCLEVLDDQVGSTQLDTIGKPNEERPKTPLKRSHSNTSLKSDYQSNKSTIFNENKSETGRFQELFLQKEKDHFDEFSKEMLSSQEINYENLMKFKSEKSAAYLAALLKLHSSGCDEDKQMFHDLSYLLSEINNEIHFFCKINQWKIARIASNQIGKTVDALAPSITALLSIGVKFIEISEKIKFFSPEKPAIIEKYILHVHVDNGQNDQDRLWSLLDQAPKNSLKQEILNHFGHFAALEAELLKGIYCLKLDSILKAMEMVGNIIEGDDFKLSNVSPFEVKYWLLICLYIISDISIEVMPKWLRPIGHVKLLKILASDEAHDNWSGLYRIYPNIHQKLKFHFNFFPRNFQNSLKKLKKVGPVTFKNRKISEMEDFSDKMGEQFLDFRVYNELIRLVLKMSGFLEKFEKTVALEGVHIELFDYFTTNDQSKIQILDDIDIVKLMLKKMVVESDDVAGKMAECVQQ